MPAVNLITALPRFVLQDEYQRLISSTPNSFADIPAVLKHKEEDVSISLDPPLDQFKQDTIGTLYVLTSVLVFASTTGATFQIEYPSITLHAVSRGPSGPSIYCQLDESAGAISSTDPSDEDTEMRELTIVPKNPASLEPIFECLSQCAALHPDPQDEEGETDDAFIDLNGSPFEVFTGDGDQELSEVGRAALAHLESIIYDPFHPKSEDEDQDHEERSTVVKTETKVDDIGGNLEDSPK